MEARDYRWIVAMQGRDGAAIHAQLKGLGLAVEQVCCLRRVSDLLDPRQLPAVVVSQLALPDGNWRDLVGLINLSRSASRVVLCVEHLTTELWWDAEEQGVLDVITPPYAQQLVNLILDPLVLPESHVGRRAAPGWLQRNEPMRDPGV
jgi:DNA-binding NtrC family response regulator